MNSRQRAYLGSLARQYRSDLSDWKSISDTGDH